MRTLIFNGKVDGDFYHDIFSKIQEIKNELDVSVFEEAVMDFLISVQLSKGGNNKVRVYFNYATFLKGLPVKFGRKLITKEK